MFRAYIEAKSLLKQVSTSYFMSKKVNYFLFVPFFLGCDVRYRNAMAGCSDHQGDRYMMRHREGQTAMNEEEGHRQLMDIEGNYFFITIGYNTPPYLRGSLHFSLYSIQCAWHREREREVNT
jgi:hypothetical protein